MTKRQLTIGALKKLTIEHQSWCPTFKIWKVVSFAKNDLQTINETSTAIDLALSQCRASVQQHLVQTHTGAGYPDFRHACPRCGESWSNEVSVEECFDENHLKWVEAAILV